MNDRLETLLALNQQIASLEEAGVVVDLGIERAKLGPRLERLSNSLASQVGLGQPLEEALLSESVQAPAEYRRLVLEWLKGADLSELLRNRVATTARTEQTKRHVGGGVLYSVIVALLACLGLAGFCWLLLPAIESHYESLRQPVGAGLGWLQAARRTLPIWGVGLPLLAAFVAWWAWRSGPLPWPAWSTPTTPKASRQRLARTSDSLATLLDAGVAPGEATRLAVDGIGAQPRAAGRFPLFAWATSPTSDQSTANADDLRAVATVYDDLTDRRSKRFEVLTPILACVVIGGGATLLYGLALFVPVVELLWALSF